MQLEKEMADQGLCSVIGSFFPSKNKYRALCEALSYTKRDVKRHMDFVSQGRTSRAPETVLLPLRRRRNLDIQILAALLFRHGAGLHSATARKGIAMARAILQEINSTGAGDWRSYNPSPRQAVRFLRP